VKIKLDENLPYHLSVEIAAAGHDVDTVGDEGLAGSSDPDVLDAARTEGRMVTVDLQDVAACVVVVEPSRVRIRRPE
jgi:predicted nuclease of predicted toxin-antitoxin system